MKLNCYNLHMVHASQKEEGGELPYKFKFLKSFASNFDNTEESFVMATSYTSFQDEKVFYQGYFFSEQILSLNSFKPMLQVNRFAIASLN